jgi:hypothetical protein
MRLRHELVPKLSPLARLAYRRISNEAEDLRLDYLPSVKRDFSVELAQSQARERTYRSTLIGPHRDEPEVEETGDGLHSHPGVGTALGQIFRRNFPTEGIGAFFQAPLGNRQAQADYDIDLLQLRQMQLTTQKDFKQAQVDIVDALNADDAFHGLFVDAMAGRLNRLAVESEKVTRAEIAQEKRVREEAQRLKRAERMSGRLDLVARRNLEKLGFRDLLEGIGHDKDASLP